MAFRGTLLLTHLSEDGNVATTEVFRDLTALRAWCDAAVRPAATPRPAETVAPPAADVDAVDAAPPLLPRAVFTGEPLYAIDTDSRLLRLQEEDRECMRAFQQWYVAEALRPSGESDADTTASSNIAEALYATCVRLRRAGKAEIPTQYAPLFQIYAPECFEDSVHIPRKMSVSPDVFPDLQTLLQAHPLGALPHTTEFAFYNNTAARLPWERIAVAVYCEVQSGTIRESTLCDWMTWLLQAGSADCSASQALALLEADIARLPEALATPLQTALQYATFRKHITIRRVPVADCSLRPANFDDHVGALVSTTG